MIVPLPMGRYFDSVVPFSVTSSEDGDLDDGGNDAVPDLRVDLRQHRARRKGNRERYDNHEANQQARQRSQHGGTPRAATRPCAMRLSTNRCRGDPANGRGQAQKNDSTAHATMPALLPCGNQGWGPSKEKPLAWILHAAAFPVSGQDPKNAS